jgi:hypothetical protein
MSDFRLDVDSPYPQPSRQDLMIRPQKLNYPQSRITFKHYGKYAQNFVRCVASEQDSSRTTAEVVNIARYMRAKSFEFNNEHPNNDSIIRDIRIMAAGDIELNVEAISGMRSDYRQSPAQRGKLQRGKQQRSKQQKGGGKNSARHHAYK